MPQPATTTGNPSLEQQQVLAAVSVAVTVIVPMRNEEQRIGLCLDSILANDFDHEQLEILVVDGRSTDRSRSIVIERAACSHFIRLLDNPARIVSAGLNIGIRNARGAVIIIMGAHAEYSRNYIRTCLHELETQNTDVVGGMLETRAGGRGIVACSIALMSQHPFGVGGSAFRTQQESGYVDTVAYGAYRREVFDRIGLFNEKLTRNQDFELNARLHHSGGRLFLSGQIKAAYYNVPDFTHLVRQAFSNGYWLPPMWFSFPSSVRLRHAIPVAFVGVLVASLIVAPFHELAVVPGLVALVMYTIAVTLVAGQIARRHSLKFLFPLIGVFFTHHIIYGVGTLAGFLSCGMPFPVSRPLWNPRPTHNQP
jgi:glycosyltransferase involved in cell wall biosynthesis